LIEAGKPGGCSGHVQGGLKFFRRKESFHPGRGEEKVPSFFVAEGRKFADSGCVSDGLEEPEMPNAFSRRAVPAHQGSGAAGEVERRSDASKFNIPG